jgi:coproporphyrinogen III oxidase-like Fe-S oxidoreductase
LRTANPPSLSEYALRFGKGHIPWSGVVTSSREDAWKEFLIFGLRLAEGVSLAEGEKKCGPPPDEVREAVEKLVGSGSLLREGDRLRLPDRYWFVSNEVLQWLA